MILKALDLLRTLGWGIISFIFGLIDSLFEILKEMNAFNIIDSIAKNQIFKNFHHGILAISLTLLGLFILWRFVMKILEPDEGLSFHQIIMEIIKCTLLILLSTFLFAEVSTFSIKLSGYTASVFSNNNTTLSNNVLNLYVDYSTGYKESDEFKNENIKAMIKDKTITTAKKYNDKYVTSARWILPDEKDYKYSVNWIMAIIVGGFFLYSLFFSGMMLARRQIEFLFIFVISPVIFATSIGNKQRRSAVIEQLVSLTVQAAVVMLIISLTALIMEAVNDTTFFSGSVFKDAVIKSLMFIGCGSFLLTGSQVVNRFIGGNVSANSGREQMMSLMGFGNTMGGIASAGTLATAGAGLIGLGAISKTMSGTGKYGTGAVSKVGSALNSFGNSISGNGESTLNKIGNKISDFGKGMETFANSRTNRTNSDGLKIPSPSEKLGRFGSRMLSSGSSNIRNAVESILPASRNTSYRRKYRTKGDE